MKCVTVSIFPLSICHEVIGQDAMILVFSMLNFKPLLPLSFLTLIKRLFSSSSFSSIRAVSSAYLRSLLSLLEILISVCNSSSLAFHMTYSACKLNKQDDNIQPCHTTFPIWKQFVVPCLVLLILACIQISQEAGKMV